jgi:hypothetical protein
MAFGIPLVDSVTESTPAPNDAIFYFLFTTDVTELPLSYFQETPGVPTAEGRPATGPLRLHGCLIQGC